MKKFTLIAVLICLVISGCASNFANSYMGKTLIDLELDQGRPANVINLPDGRRAYQYYWGGGTFVTPQTSTGTVDVIGNTAYVQSQTNPATVVSSPGCLISFIAEQRNSQWVVVETRWPKRLFC